MLVLSILILWGWCLGTIGQPLSRLDLPQLASLTQQRGEIQRLDWSIVEKETVQSPQSITEDDYMTLLMETPVPVVLLNARSNTLFSLVFHAGNNQVLLIRFLGVKVYCCDCKSFFFFSLVLFFTCFLFDFLSLCLCVHVREKEIERERDAGKICCPHHL